jgi:DNA polymerase-1
MEKRLFLLDGMAMAYRAHFAFVARPIRTSAGVDTSALFGFAATVLDLVQTERPSHIAVVFDTPVPTHRHRLYPEYKAHREAMPEALSAALPHLRRFAAAFGIPVLAVDGWEADDVIGTLATRAAQAGFLSFMVTPDKDFGQLVSDRVLVYKPGLKGDPPEVLGVPEVLARWEIGRAGQVIDMLGLVGDASDNIPGVPGIGPKTAKKLLAEYDNLENLLAHAGQIEGKLGEKLARFAGQARLSKTLATIDCSVPLGGVLSGLDALAFGRPDTGALQALMTEFEFRSLAKRVFGTAGSSAPAPDEAVPAAPAPSGQGELFAFLETAAPTPAPPAAAPRPPEQLDFGLPTTHRTIADVPHTYEHVVDAAGREALAARLCAVRSFCFDTETDGLEPRTAPLVGLALCWEPHHAFFVRMPSAEPAAIAEALQPFRAAFADPSIEKVGHNLKFDIAALAHAGLEVEGPLFDTMLAHALAAPDQRHGMDFSSEALLDYTPIPLSRLIGAGDAPGGPKRVSQADPAALAEYSAEDADVTWQLRAKLQPLLRERGQERVFHEVEMPLVAALAAMEREGVAVDTAALAAFGIELRRQAAELEARIFALVGHPFNLASPKQLGEVLFGELALAEKPKKTRTGQFATDEQTLAALAGRHPVVQAVLEHRETAKLESTYVTALPAAVDPATGRVHTHFGQLRTATGRLSSDKPNLQNIPVRSGRGREIRRAFVPRGPEWLLLSADYSQIELRIIAALSGDPGMLDAFARGDDIHTATAARVFGVALGAVTREMRARAKMVNFGIPYGISAFGLAQRLGCPRAEAEALIGGYFAQFAGIRRYIDTTLEFARTHGWVETVTGRRRYLPDITSANGTIRAGAERNAINTPIQGTAADMIKIAMSRIHGALRRGGLRTRLVLQVHDELLFDLFRPEEPEVRALVEELMRTALPLACPIAVDLGTGATWLEAH